MQLPGPIHNLWVKYKDGLQQIPTLAWIVNIALLTMLAEYIYKYFLG